VASRVVPLVGGAALGAVLAGKVLGRRSGSTAARRVRALAGDDLVESPSLVTNHANTIEAPAARVWPWLTQVGWHRGWVRPWWVNAGYLALIVPADHVMATGMLRGLKRRVEAAR
jgi:hypothetical protein